MPTSLIELSTQIILHKFNSPAWLKHIQKAKAFLPQIPADEYPYLNGLSQQMIDGRHDGLHDFEFGLDLILDGLERLRDTA